METKIETAQAKKHRSPAYPSIDLETAVQKTALLYEGIKRNPTHVDTALTTMGYKISSTGSRAVAAMISYGLLEEDGAGPQRTVKLTKSALDLQHLADDDPDRAPILQTMALSPKIFKELINKYPGQLPNDATIEKYLKVTREFNPEAVRPLIRSFRSTYQFANLNDVDTLSSTIDDDEEDQASLDFPEETHSSVASVQQALQPTPTLNQPQQREIQDVKMSNVSAEMQTLTIPMPRGRMAYLQYPAHSTAADFRFMEKTLALMQEALVEEAKTPVSIRNASSIRFGAAIWHGPDHNVPVNIIGYWGEEHGRQYVRIEGSDTGVPFDEIEYSEI